MSSISHQKDGNTEIHTIEWKPDKEVKAVLQLCHGMVEYIGRYDEFAQFLCDKGYYVVGNDHLGHGKSVQANVRVRIFQSKNMEMYVVLGDIHTLRQRTAKKHPDVPYFMLGHSMGSSLFKTVYRDVRKRSGRCRAHGHCRGSQQSSASLRKAALPYYGCIPRLALPEQTGG